MRSLCSSAVIDILMVKPSNPEDAIASSIDGLGDEAHDDLSVSFLLVAVDYRTGLARKGWRLTLVRELSRFGARERPGG